MFSRYITAFLFAVPSLSLAAAPNAIEIFHCSKLGPKAQSIGSLSMIVEDSMQLKSVSGLLLDNQIGAPKSVDSKHTLESSGEIKISGDIASVTLSEPTKLKKISILFAPGAKAGFGSTLMRAGEPSELQSLVVYEKPDGSASLKLITQAPGVAGGFQATVYPERNRSSTNHCELRSLELLRALQK